MSDCLKRRSKTAAARPAASNERRKPSPHVRQPPTTLKKNCRTSDQSQRRFRRVAGRATGSNEGQKTPPGVQQPLPSVKNARRAAAGAKNSDMCRKSLHFPLLKPPLCALSKNFLCPISCFFSRFLRGFALTGNICGSSSAFLWVVGTPFASLRATPPKASEGMRNAGGACP